MKRLTLTLATLTLVHTALAQEAIPLDRAQKGARMLTRSLAQTSDLPLAADVDLEKPHAFKAGDVAVMIIPDKHLNADTISGAKDAVVPLGQLWMYHLVPRLNGQAIAADKLRTLVVTDDGKDMHVQMYLIGAAKNSQGALELALYSKDKEPVARIPVVSGLSAKQDLPLEIFGHKEDDQSGILTINILGQHRAELLLQKLEE